MKKRQLVEVPKNHSVSRARVLYADTDTMGVVYHANYLRWFEAGRGDYMRHRGISYADVESRGILLPAIEAHIYYYKPAKYDDILDVFSWVQTAKGAQISFNYSIARGEETLVQGSTAHAAMRRNGQAVRIPKDLIELLDRQVTTPRAATELGPVKGLE